MANAHAIDLFRHDTSVSGKDVPELTVDEWNQRHSARLATLERCIDYDTVSLDIVSLPGNGSVRNRNAEKIRHYLQRVGRAQNAAIAKNSGMAPSAVAPVMDLMIRRGEVTREGERGKFWYVYVRDTRKMAWQEKSKRYCASMESRSKGQVSTDT